MIAVCDESALMLMWYGKLDLVADSTKLLYVQAEVLDLYLCNCKYNISVVRSTRKIVRRTEKGRYFAQLYSRSTPGQRFGNNYSSSTQNRNANR